MLRTPGDASPPATQLPEDLGSGSARDENPATKSQQQCFCFRDDDSMLTVLRLGFRYLNHLAPHVIAARRADYVGRNRLAALGAKRQLAGLLGIMRTSFSSSRIGMLALGNSHLTTSKQASLW